MKRYMLVYQDKDGNSNNRMVVGETAASAALAALLVKIDWWAAHNRTVTVREEPPTRYRKGDEITTIWVGF